MANNDLKTAISNAISEFENQPLRIAALGLLNALGYRSDRELLLKQNNAKQFQAEFDPKGRINPALALLEEWLSVDLLFQLTDAEIQSAIKGMDSLFAAKKVDNTDIRSYLFFAVELKGDHYTRTQLAGVTREINKLFPMPVLVIFKHGRTLSISIIARRSNKKDESKDVLEKVTLIKDIRFVGNRPHIEILHDLSLGELVKTYTITNFLELQKAWEKTLDTNELNKKFYKEIANWYFWAVKSVKFPKDAEKDEETRNATSVIRLITRLIFVWFIKEKGLVPEDLFDPRRLNELLNFTDPKKSTYYKAILQNLFFATLNTEMGAGRTFRRKNTGGLDPDYLMSNYYRYKDYFKKPEEALKLFAGIPFLNGGLFECLDKEIEKGRVVRIDGFSDRDDNPLQVPDDLFLLEKEKEIDLNEIYDTRNKKYKVRGLIHIFNSYKFTIEENTPIEEEIALDPELLGKVFENLLAAYNPETGTTARKQTGSFYTPREIVNYMVDEALIAYLESAISEKDEGGGRKVELQNRLRTLLSYSNEPHDFKEAETSRLIAAIDNVKVLDPACGSGAFPMGVLHKLVFLLAKLDPHNERWQTKQISKATEIQDAVAREAAVRSIEQVFAENFDDYGRKLYLIENCIYGVDIQPIAVQIAKLRFFISLVVDQKMSPHQPNLGIRPLPNLETKFVAANTLIGIQRPDTKPADETSASLSPKVEEACELLVRKLEQFLKSRNPDLRARYIKEAQEFADVINVGMGADFQPLSADWIFTTAKDTSTLKNLLPVKREEKVSPLVLRNQEIEAKEKELERVRREHFSARTPATKRKYRDLDKKLRLEIADLLRRNHALEDEIAQQLAGWDPYNQNTHAEFFDPEWMFGLEDGFDVVIGNPPYVSHDKINEKSLLKIQYESYEPFADIYCYFVEKAISLQNKNGILSFITSNSFLRAEYGSPLRKFIRKHNELLDIVNLEDAQVFESAIVNVVILISRKKSSNAKCFVYNSPYPGSDDFAGFIKSKGFFYEQNLFDSKSWSLIEPEKVDIQKKMEKQGKTLEQLGAKIRLGLATGNNDAFIIDDDKRRALIRLNRKNSEIIKPVLRGRDIFRYHYEFPNLYILLTKNGVDVKKDYPDIYKHFDAFGAAFKNRGAQGQHWTNLRAVAFFDDFKEEKIVWIELTDTGRFALCTDEIYLLNTAYFLLPPPQINVKYLLGVLNSKLIYFYLGLIAETSGMGVSRWINNYVKEFPIIEASIEKQSFFAQLVDQILTAKRANPAADTRELERKIDELVYQLYGLTEEEIKIVEGR